MCHRMQEEPQRFGILLFMSALKGRNTGFYCQACFGSLLFMSALKGVDDLIKVTLCFGSLLFMSALKGQNDGREYSIISSKSKIE